MCVHTCICIEVGGCAHIYIGIYMCVCLCIGKCAYICAFINNHAGSILQYFNEKFIVIQCIYQSVLLK